MGINNNSLTPLYFFQAAPPHHQMGRVPPPRGSGSGSSINNFYVLDVPVPANFCHVCMNKLKLTALHCAYVQEQGYDTVRIRSPYT